MAMRRRDGRRADSDGYIVRDGSFRPDPDRELSDRRAEFFTALGITVAVFAIVQLWR